MGEKVRKVVFDEELEIEAYQFEGIMQKFPNHFHEHYVIGFLKKVIVIFCAKTKAMI